MGYDYTMLHRLSFHGLLPLAFGLGLGLSSGACAPPPLPEALTWGEPPLVPYRSQPRLAITNNGDDTLSFLALDDPARLRLLGSTAVGNSPLELEGPHHLAPSADGRHLFFNLSNYVVRGGGGPHGAHGNGTAPGYLVKLDLATHRTVGQVLVDRSPGDVIISRDGQRVYVSHYDEARYNAQVSAGRPEVEGYSALAIVDAADLRLRSLSPLCPTAHGMGESPDGQRLYVTCTFSDQLAVVDVRDPAAPQVIRKVSLGAGSAPYALSVAPDGRVWISTTGANDVRVYDPAADRLDPRRVPLAGPAMFGAFSADGATFFVPNQGAVASAQQVTAIDTTTLATRALTLNGGGDAACAAPHALLVLPNPSTKTDAAALVCEGEHHHGAPGSVLLLGLSPLAVRGGLPVGIFPDGAALLPPI